MKKINIIGELFGTSGYASHTRSLFNALAKIADCKLTVPLYINWQSSVNDAELKAILQPERIEDINLIITTPHNWKLYTKVGRNIAYCVWEGNKVPESYIEEFLNPDIEMILVPSAHTSQAISNTTDKIEILKKIKIIPHGVDTSIFYSQRKKDKGDGSNVSLSGDTKQLQGQKNKDEHMPVNVDNHSDTPFTFICNKGWRGTSWDRGGVQYLLKAFAEEFKSNEKVKLIIKLNPAYMNAQILPQSINALQLPENRAPIQVILDDMNFNQLRELYNQSDCFVCATRAEAFDLGSGEAMSCGLPCLTSGFGGQIEHMKENENALFFEYDIVEVKEDIMYEEVSWCIPRIEDMKKKMRWCFNNQFKIKEMGKNAENFIKEFNWDKTAQKIISVLENK